MPARRYPLDIDLIIRFELARTGIASGPDLWRRAVARMQESGYKLHSGAWYPALERLYRRNLIGWTKKEVSMAPRKTRVPKTYALSPAGAKEARRLSTILRNLILPIEASD